jgi:dolichol-phosphate mannosyltransferase
LFKGAGLTIVEVPVQHRPRRYGESKYNNLSRAVRGLYDLVGVSWLLRRRIRFPKIETADERSHD